MVCRINVFPFNHWRARGASIQGVHPHRFKECILSCLPTDTVSVVLEVSVQRHGNLSESILYTFVGLGMQDVFQHAKGLVAAVAQGHAPQFGGATLPVDFEAKVKERLNKVCRVEESDAADGPATTCRQVCNQEEVFDVEIRVRGWP